MERLSLRTIRYLLAALVLLVMFAGCGGGGGGSSSSQLPDTGIFTPNYISSLNGLFHWDHLPLRIHFSLPGNWNTLYASNPDLQVDAGNEWNQPGLQALVSTVGSGADVEVTFVSQSSLGGNTQGITRYTYDASTSQMATASIKVALDDGSGHNLAANDIQSVIAHEIGHALGIGGHSPNSSDLLYPSLVFGAIRYPSQLDFNTIMTAYSGYFGRSVPPTRSITTPDMRTAEIE